MTADVNKIDSLKGEPAASVALASGASYRGAAQAADVTLRTISRRMEDPIYRRRVQELRADMIEGASGRLAHLTLRAAARLGKLINSPNDQVALGACRAILDQASRYRELVELSERVTAIEAQLHDQPGHRIRAVK